MPVPIQPACVECGLPAVAGVTSLGATVYHCGDPDHQLCARRALGLPDVAG